MILETGKENYIKAEMAYLRKFGNDSLDRVLLCDPVNITDEELQETADILEKAIREEQPLEQIEPEIWSQMFF